MVFYFYFDGVTVKTGNRFSCEKTFLLITSARFKILIFCVFEIEERLVMFNLALKNVFAKN